MSESLTAVESTRPTGATLKPTTPTPPEQPQQQPLQVAAAAVSTHPTLPGTQLRPPLPFRFPVAGTPGSEHDATIIRMIDNGHSWAEIEKIAGEAAFDRYYNIIDPDLEPLWTEEAIMRLDVFVREQLDNTASLVTITNGALKDTLDTIPWDKIASSMNTTAGICLYVWRTFGEGRPLSDEELVIKMKEERARIEVEEEQTRLAEEQQDARLTQEKQEKAVARLAKEAEKQEQARVTVEERAKAARRKAELQIRDEAVLQAARNIGIGTTASSSSRLSNQLSRIPSNPQESWKTRASTSGKGATPDASDLVPATHSSLKTAAPKSRIFDIKHFVKTLVHDSDESTRQGWTRGQVQAQKLAGVRKFIQGLVQAKQHEVDGRDRATAKFMEGMAACRLEHQKRMQKKNLETQTTISSQTALPAPPSHPSSSSSTLITSSKQDDYVKTGSPSVQPPLKRQKINSHTANHILPPITIDLTDDEDDMPTFAFPVSTSTNKTTNPSTAHMATRLSPTQSQARQILSTSQRDSASESVVVDLTPDAAPPSATAPATTAGATSFPAPSHSFMPMPKLPRPSHHHAPSRDRRQQEQRQEREQPQESHIKVQPQSQAPERLQQQFSPPQKRTNWPSPPPGHLKSALWTAEDVIKIWNVRQQVGDNWDLISRQALGGKHSPQACRAFVTGEILP